MNFTVTAKLIYAFVFAYAKCWFSHDMAQFYIFEIVISISLTFLWDIGKQCSPRSDAAECGIPSWAILFA